MDNTSQRLLAIGASDECVQWLREQAFEVESVDRLPRGLERLATQPFDLVLYQLALTDSSGRETFKRVQAAAPQVPVIVLARAEDEALALETLRWGAQDYLLAHELSPAMLTGAIRKGIERHRGLETARIAQNSLELLMSKIPDAIYFKDVDSRFLRISRAHARRFGLADPSLAIGKTDADFFTTAHAQQARADEQRIIQTGLPLVGIEEMETWPDGSISWVSTTKMPLRDPTGRIIGTFGISRNITARKDAELALAERTRQLRQRNQQMEEELKMARELQIAMLPQQFPRVPPNGGRDSALEFFSFYFPAGLVSGDFYDVVELSDTAVGLFICDVMGHDVRAALVTAMMRSLVEDLSEAALEPGHLLDQINRGLAGVFKQTGTTMYATALYLVADVASGEVRYASAAHPDALHVHRLQGTVDTLSVGTDRRGPALGLFEGASYQTCRRSLAAGDLLLLFTDGLTEAEGKAQELFSAERLAAAVRQRARLPASELFNEVIGEIRQFCGTGEFGDDASMLGMEIKRLGP